jgi:hypothetical protein
MGRLSHRLEVDGESTRKSSVLPSIWTLIGSGVLMIGRKSHSPVCIERIMCCWLSVITILGAVAGSQGWSIF